MRINKFKHHRIMAYLTDQEMTCGGVHLQSSIELLHRKKNIMSRLGIILPPCHQRIWNLIWSPVWKGGIEHPNLVLTGP